MPYINQGRKEAQKKDAKVNASAKPLPLLVASLRAAKAAENAAKEYRLQVEEEILAQLPDAPQEGSYKDAGGEFTVAYKLTRSVDSEGIQTVWGDLTANAQKAFKVKFDIDLKQYRAIQDLDPQSFAQLAAFVTSKPAKPTITIKE